VVGPCRHLLLSPAIGVTINNSVQPKTLVSKREMKTSTHARSSKSLLHQVLYHAQTAIWKMLTAALSARSLKTGSVSFLLQQTSFITYFLAHWKTKRCGVLVPISVSNSENSQLEIRPRCLILKHSSRYSSVPPLQSLGDSLYCLNSSYPDQLI
jgi:hypothetical protein